MGENLTIYLLAFHISFNFLLLLFPKFLLKYILNSHLIKLIHVFIFLISYFFFDKIIMLLNQMKK